MAKTSKELMDLASSIADQLAGAMELGKSDEKLTVVVVIGNANGWASAERGDGDVAEVALRHALESAQTPEGWTTAAAPVVGRA